MPTESQPQLRTFLREVWRNAVNAFSAASLILALIFLLPFWNGWWAKALAVAAVGASLLHAMYGAWRQAMLATPPFAVPPLTTLEPQVSAILRDELARRATIFRSSVSSTVAEFGASENRYSTSLVSRLEALGVAELELRSALILETWRRFLSKFAGGLRPDLLKAVADLALQQLAAQRQDIEAVVNGVDMRRVPRDMNFLESAFSRCESRVRAEVELL